MGGKERTEAGFTGFLESAGMELIHVWRVPGVPGCLCRGYVNEVTVCYRDAEDETPGFLKREFVSSFADSREFRGSGLNIRLYLFERFSLRSTQNLGNKKPMI